MTQTTSVTLREGWPPAAEKCARWIALGCTQDEAAKREAVNIRTLQRWLKAGLQEYSNELRATAWQRVDPQLWANLEHALALQQEVYSGKRPVKDPVYQEAKRFIERALSYRATQSRFSSARESSAGSDDEES